MTAPAPRLTSRCALRNLAVQRRDAQRASTEEMHSDFAPAAPVRRAHFIPRSAPLLVLLLGAMLWPGSFAAAAPAPSGEVTHVVIFWLKDPQNRADREAIARACRELGRLPGVVRVEVGNAMPVVREGIEQEFDMSAIFTLRDRAALAEYQKSPEHTAAVRDVLKPLVKRYVVFDSISD